MISVEKAKNLISKNIPPLHKETRHLKNALGCILAEDIECPLNLPRYDNSAMDGFALRVRDTLGATSKKPATIKILGTIRAGSGKKVFLNSRGAYRIMTGSVIPIGADSVLPKEEARIRDNSLIVHQSLLKGRHIRYKGEEVKKGERVLCKESFIHPGTIGILASLGKIQVEVFRKPLVSLIATGSELVQPGNLLKFGKIYDSNSWMISAALQSMGLPLKTVKSVKDRPQGIRRAIGDAFDQSHVVILTGGVSVGDYDYVKEILKEFEVRTIFWKVNQKPGKPLFFGRRKNQLVFGLPGNPASVYICFYEYVYSALRRMMGFVNPDLRKVTLSLQEPIASDPSKMIFLKGKASDVMGEKLVKFLQHQASHMISSLNEMDSVVCIPPGKGFIRKGTKVHVDQLPYGGDGVM